MQTLLFGSKITVKSSPNHLFEFYEDLFLKVFYMFISLFFILMTFAGFAQQCRGEADSKPLNVLYFSPETEENSFWGLQRKYTHAVAKDLNINLNIVEIKESEHYRFAFIDLVDSYINVEQKPDLVLGIFYLNGEKTFLDYLQTMKMPFFSVNASISAKSLEKIGLPRENYPYWIGHIAPNDEKAGYDLTNDLLALQKDRALMMAIAGQNQSTVSYNRRAGLIQVQEQKQFQLLPSIQTDWGPHEAQKAIKTVFRRFPEINTIWTVGTGAAQGVTWFFNETEKGRGNIKIGTFDWSPVVLDLIVNGHVDVSYGGHFREAGWALLLAYDYFSGIDFNSDTGSYIQTQLQAATKENSSEILGRINQNWHNVDFKKMTKCLNPKLEQYLLQ